MARLERGNIDTRISKEIQTSINSFNKSSNADDIKVYKLIFSIDDFTFETEFQFCKCEHGDIDIYNKCISINIFLKYSMTHENFFESCIRKNSKQTCFKPPLTNELLETLSKSSRPIKQTDILQVLSTKIKLAINGNLPLSITDIAQIKIGETPPFGLFSAWRITRGERSIYERYGYRSDIVEIAKENARKKTLNDLTRDWESLAMFLKDRVPHIFNDTNGDKTIAELMQGVSYESLSHIGVFNSDKPYHSIVEYLFEYLTKGIKNISSGGDSRMIKLVLNPESSEEWNEWSKRLQFIDWIEVKNTSGGKRRRRSRQRQRKSRQRKSRQRKS